jgi:hypothetical protein
MSGTYRVLDQFLDQAAEPETPIRKWYFSVICFDSTSPYLYSPALIWLTDIGERSPYFGIRVYDGYDLIADPQALENVLNESWAVLFAEFTDRHMAAVRLIERVAARHSVNLFCFEEQAVMQLPQTSICTIRADESCNAMSWVDALAMYFLPPTFTEPEFNALMCFDCEDLRIIMNGCHSPRLAVFEGANDADAAEKFEQWLTHNTLAATTYLLVMMEGGESTDMRCLRRCVGAVRNKISPEAPFLFAAPLTGRFRISVLFANKESPCLS